jgi:hypothetical protein
MNPPSGTTGSLAANRTLDPDEVLGLVARFTRTLLGADYAAVRAGEGGGLRACAAVGLRTQVPAAEDDSLARAGGGVRAAPRAFLGKGALLQHGEPRAAHPHQSRQRVQRPPAGRRGGPAPGEAAALRGAVARGGAHAAGADQQPARLRQAGRRARGGDGRAVHPARDPGRRPHPRSFLAAPSRVIERGGGTDAGVREPGLLGVPWFQAGDSSPVPAVVAAVFNRRMVPRRPGRGRAIRGGGGRR